MRKSGYAVCAAAMSAGLVFAGPASAASLKECNAEWAQKKADKETGGQKYADFRKECLAGTAAAPSAAPPAEPAGEPIFPAAISPKYSTESAGLARRHTCLDQYNENKANNGNGGLKWLAHGGYFSQCNTKLKELKSS
jgi:hypothetical protein